MVMEVEGVFLFACITILSLILFVLSLLSYWKYKKIKLLLIGIVFLIFLVRGVMLSLSLFYDEILTVTSSIYIWVFDLIILSMLYITSIKK